MKISFTRIPVNDPPEAFTLFKKPPAKTGWGFEAVPDDTCGNYIQLQQL